MSSLRQKFENSQWLINLENTGHVVTAQRFKGTSPGDETGIRTWAGDVAPKTRKNSHLGAPAHYIAPYPPPCPGRSAGGRHRPQERAPRRIEGAVLLPDPGNLLRDRRCLPGNTPAPLDAPELNLYGVVRRLWQSAFYDGVSTQKAKFKITETNRKGASEDPIHKILDDRGQPKRDQTLGLSPLGQRPNIVVGVTNHRYTPAGQLARGS